jgi:hypothetical protein
MTNWSNIRNKVGPCGTYLFGSVKRMEPDWIRRFHAEAWAHGFRAYVSNGHLYLDRRAPW